MKDLLEDTNCTMFKVKNPETEQTEIIIRFSLPQSKRLWNLQIHLKIHQNIQTLMRQAKI